MSGRAGRRRSRPRRRRRGPRRVAANRTSVTTIIYSKNLSFTKFYDNNGVDEQGLSVVLSFNTLFPAAASDLANDYVRCCTLDSVKMTVRWGAGFSNPPIMVGMQWRRQARNDTLNWTWNGPSKWLNSSKPVTLFAVAPPPVRNYVLENPTEETAMSLRIKFYGMDLVKSDIPAMCFTTTFRQEPVLPIAHSGK